MRANTFALLLAASIALAPGLSRAEEVRVAAASNFRDTLKAIVARYEADSADRVVMSFGSTGKHYAQILNGAPFDIFFAADVRRPELLDKAGVAVPGTRFTYAVGKLVLWSPRVGYVDPDGMILAQGDFRFLSIANPGLAPYGQAAQEVLQARGLQDALGGRLVRGENVGQAWQFVRSGNAELGFVARSQLSRPGRPAEGSFWEVPQALYTPIEQQAVLLKDRQAARAFLRYMRSHAILEMIRDYGYDTP